MSCCIAGDGHPLLGEGLSSTVMDTGLIFVEIEAVKLKKSQLMF